MRSIDDLQEHFDVVSAAMMVELMNGQPISAHTPGNQACGAVLVSLYACWVRLCS